MPRTRTKSRNVKRGGQCAASSRYNTFVPVNPLLPLPLGGGRRSRGLSRKSAKKVKRCVKKASRKKSAKARRSATRKCMKLKKRLRKQ